MANLYGVSAYQQTNRQREDNDLQPSRYDRFARPDNEERIWDGDWKCGAV